MLYEVNLKFRYWPDGLTSIKWTVELSPYGPFLELDWTDITNVSMSALAVVKSFYVIEHIGARLVAGPIDAPFDTFTFYTGKEALHHRIVVTTSSTAHATADAMLFQ